MIERRGVARYRSEERKEMTTDPNIIRGLRNSYENESVAAMCAHCKQTLFRELPSGNLMHVNGLRSCRNGSGVYGAERVETAAANLLLNEECRAVALSGQDYWAIPRDIYDDLRKMLEDWPK